MRCPVYNLLSIFTITVAAPTEPQPQERVTPVSF